MEPAEASGNKWHWFCNSTPAGNACSTYRVLSARPHTQSRLLGEGRTPDELLHQGQHHIPARNNMGSAAAPLTQHAVFVAPPDRHLVPVIDFLVGWRFREDHVLTARETSN